MLYYFKRVLCQHCHQLPTCAPHIHQCNAAKRATRTFKNHFIAALCSTDKDFPLHPWDKSLPQAIVTLNLLQGSCLNPKLSAYAQVHRAFDCNRTPIAPPGIRALTHKKPGQRGTWVPHTKEGWHVGPTMDSCRHCCIWCPEMRST